MYMYDYYLKNNSRKIFYTDESDIPKEILDFCEENKDNIKTSFCDHFPMTVKEFVGKKKLKPYEIVCEVK